MFERRTLFRTFFQTDIVEIIKIINDDTKRVIKGTHLLDESYWGNDGASGKRQQIIQPADAEKLANDNVEESDQGKGMFSGRNTSAMKLFRDLFSG